MAAVDHFRLKLKMSTIQSGSESERGDKRKDDDDDDYDEEDEKLDARLFIRLEKMMPTHFGFIFQSLCRIEVETNEPR